MQPMWLSFFVIFNLYSILEHILGWKNINAANILLHFQQIVIFEIFKKHSEWKKINAVNVISLFSRNSNFTSHLKMHYEEKQNTFLIKHITAVNVTRPFQGIVILQVISKYILGRNQISAMWHEFQREG